LAASLQKKLTQEMLDRGLAMRVGLNGSSFKSVTSPGDKYFFEKVLQVVNPTLIAPNAKIVKERIVGIATTELKPKVRLFFFSFSLV
jgi:hypothetical protein